MPENIDDLFLLCRGQTFDHVLGDEIDHVSPMFISENRSKYGKQNECLHILFFYNPNKFFCTVIPEICLTASVIHLTLNLITNIDFVVTLGPEAEHLTLNFVCKLVFSRSF